MPILAEVTTLFEWKIGKQIWPPPKPPLVVQVVGSMVPAFDPRHHAGRWHEVVGERDERQRKDSDRVSAHNEQRERGREDAANPFWSLGPTQNEAGSGSKDVWRLPSTLPSPPLPADGKHVSERLRRASCARGFDVAVAGISECDRISE